MADPKPESPKVEAPADAKEVKGEATSSPTPIFGAGFGNSAGFGGFTGVTAPAAADTDDDDKPPEEDCKAEFKPLVQLEEVEANTGEEDEDCLLEMKAKLYRYEQENNQWKERGIGQAKFLQNKENKKIRFLMRQEKTLKIRANHIVMPGTKLSSHAGNDKAWVWSTVDFADEEQKIEMFAIRFGSVERANEFKAKFEECMDLNETLFKKDGVEVPTADASEVDAEADAAADALAKASV